MLKQSVVAEMGRRETQRRLVVVYDADNTALNTKCLHEEAWRHAFAAVDMPCTDEFIERIQPGRTNREALRMWLLGDDFDKLGDALIAAKVAFVMANASSMATFFPDWLEAVPAISDRAAKVWIATSSNRAFVDAVAATEPLFEGLPKMTAEDWGRKPDMLADIMRREKCQPMDLVYVGDSIASDRSAAEQCPAGPCRFVLYDREGKHPEMTDRITRHTQLTELLDSIG